VVHGERLRRDLVRDGRALTGVRPAPTRTERPGRHAHRIGAGGRPAATRPTPAGHALDTRLWDNGRVNHDSRTAVPRAKRRPLTDEEALVAFDLAERHPEGPGHEGPGAAPGDDQVVRDRLTA
jgi:hypothetical protein